MPEKCTRCPALKCPPIAQLRCPARLKVQPRRGPVYYWHRWGVSGEAGGAMGDIASKMGGIAGSYSLGGCGAPALLLAGSSALAQEKRGAEQQRAPAVGSVRA